MPEWAIAVLAFFGASFGVVVGILLQEFALRPVLKVETLDDKFYSAVDGNIHHRLRIHNIGLRAAVGCTAVLTLQDITRDDVASVSGPILTPSSFNESPQLVSEEGLHWSPIGNPASITINKRASARLDFYFVPLRTAPALILVHSEQSGIMRIALLGSRRYQGNILITASNANSRTVFFSLEPVERDVGLRITKIEPRLWPSPLRYLIPGQ